jgi:hypothetical protein
MSISAMKYALDVLDNYVEDPRCEAHRATAVHFLEQAIAEAEQPDLARVGEIGVWGDKREWVGLTDEERLEVASRKWWHWEDAFDIGGFARAIEQALKEKNT